MISYLLESMQSLLHSYIQMLTYCKPIFCSQEDDFDFNEDDAGYGAPSSVSTLALPNTNTWELICKYWLYWNRKCFFSTGTYRTKYLFSKEFGGLIYIVAEVCANPINFGLPDRFSSWEGGSGDETRLKDPPR